MVIQPNAPDAHGENQNTGDYKMNELITTMVIIALASLVAGMLLSLGYYLGRVHEAKALDEHIETQRIRIKSLIKGNN